ncbi:MAG TPA: DUF2275 domain-containing protein [Syntrophales bacterium]|nr:DUF2275 domain-containing protein [Syntrophales bacterium]
MESRLAALIDGSLPDGEKDRAEAHLRSCESCRKALAELRASDALVKGLGEVEPPPWLKTRVMARVREEAQGKESVFRRLFYPLHVKLPIQALATVLIAVAAWNVYRTAEPDFRQAVPPPAAVQESPEARVPAPAADAAMKAESPATREKRALAPPPAILGDRRGRAVEPARERAGADAAAPGRAESVSAPATDEEASKGADAMSRPERDRAARVPAPAQTRKDLKTPAGAVPKGGANRDAAPTGAAPMLSAALSPGPDLDIAILARDPVSAAAEMEALLRKIGAESVERKARDGREALTARIRPEHLETLREKMKSLGQVRETVQAAPRPGAPLTVRMEFRSP